MNTNAVVLVTFQPNSLYLDFLQTFLTYDIYIVIDDNDFNMNAFKLKYPKFQFIQMDNNECIEKGFCNLNMITLRKPVSGWDKALYYLSYINVYDYVWFMEDDVYFHSETTLQNIDNKYNVDVLCNSSFESAKLNEWLWNRIQINFQPPYYCGMMCITRFSKNMINSISDYAAKNKTLFFLEACYPTIAIKYNLTYILNPEEFLTVTYREIHDTNKLNKAYLYHPMKNIANHSIHRTL